MNNYIKTLYFSINAATVASDAAADAIMLTVDRFTNMQPVTSQTTLMTFLDVENTGAAETKITLTHGDGQNLDAMEQVMTALNSNPKDGFIVIADGSGGVFADNTQNVIESVALTQI